MSTTDEIDHPDHYNWHPSGVECQTIVREFSYNVGTAISYLWRHNHKGTPISDLYKARKHIEFEIARLEERLEEQLGIIEEEQ